MRGVAARSSWANSCANKPKFAVKPSNQATACRLHRRLGAGGRAELFEDNLRFALGAGGAAAQRSGTLLIVGPRGDHPEHLEIFIAEADFALRLHVAHLSKLPEHTVEQRRADQPLAALHRMDGADERVIGDALEQIAMGAGLQR